MNVSRTKKQQAVDNVFNPTNGLSEWVSRETINKSPEKISLSSNGNQRHGIFFGDTRYKWVSKKEGRSVSHLRLNGLNDDALSKMTHYIRDDIHEYHKITLGKCVVCGSTHDLVTDHKNDLYNEPRVLSKETQTMKDFQCLCRHCNILKGKVSKKTRETGKRYGATNIPSAEIFGVDFISGDETYKSDDVNAMVGTYWYDPVEFMKQIKRGYVHIPK